jgi:hypothetical protein
MIFEKSGFELKEQCEMTALIKVSLIFENVPKMSFQKEKFSTPFPCRWAFVRVMLWSNFLEINPENKAPHC